MSTQNKKDVIRVENVVSEQFIPAQSEVLDISVPEQKDVSAKQNTKTKKSGFKKTTAAKSLKGFATSDVAVKNVSSSGLVALDDQQTATSPFIALFFSILEQLFKTTFKNTQFYAISFIVTDFFTNSVNDDFLHVVSYAPEMFPYYTRRRSDQTKRTERKIKENASLLTLKDGTDISYADADKIIRARLVPFMDLYWKVFEYVSIQKRIDGFHSLQAHHVWYYDLTQVEWFGDGTKDSAPYLLFIIDCASRKVVHWALFSNKEPITSTLLLQEVDKAIDKTAYKPIILHSDGDPKNISYEIISGLMDRQIIPSLNKNFYGVTDNPHENQVIESFNRRFKEQLKKHLQNCNVATGSLQSSPLSDLEPYVEAVLDQYHNKAHKHLSKISFDKANSIPVTPNQAMEAHDLFTLLKTMWDACVANLDVSTLPANIDHIKNLDFSKTNDQLLFVEFAQNFIYNKIADDSQDLSNSGSTDVITLNKMRDESYSNNFYQVVDHCYQLLFAFAMGHSDRNEKLISKFMHNQLPATVKGPGRANIFTDDFKQLLATKEQFVEYYGKYREFSLSIIAHLVKRFFLREQAFLFEKHAQDIKLDTRAALAQQTVELKQHNVEMQERTSTEIQSLNEQIDNLKSLYEDTKIHLESYLFSDQQRLEAREKRKNRVQKIPTSPVTYNIFVECLNSLVSNGVTKPIQKYANARDRISIFLIFFSGMRVAMLAGFSFLQLATIFAIDPETLSSQASLKPTDDVSVAVSKKRKAEQQTFAVSKIIQKDYIYSNHNLQADFLVLCQRVKEYAIEKSLNYSDLLEKPYYTTFQKVDQVISRENLNKNINNITRRGADLDSGGKMSQKTLKTFSSHSFRYYIATTIIANYDVRTAQQFLHHSSLATTAHYDRNILSNDKIRIITTEIADKSKNLPNKFTEEQIREFGFRVASNKPFTELELAKIESQALQIEPFHEELAKTKADKTQRHVEYKKKARSNKKKG